MYSLVTEGSSGKQTMNMLTYASPIALRPQRKYALGLYVQSLTYQNMKETGKGVLQVKCLGLGGGRGIVWTILPSSSIHL